MTRVVVLGAAGQVGGELMRCEWPAGHLVSALTRSDLDLCDADAIDRMFDALDPEIVINAAAFTGVDLAEERAELAMVVNAGAPSRLALRAEERGAVLIHISTDYVFDGSAGRPYREDDVPSPLGAYGRSKLAGETAVLGAGDHLVLRTSWVYGALGPNFVRTMRRVAGSGGDLRVVDDQRGCPTAARDVASAIVEIVAQGTPHRGLFHVAAPDSATWWELARHAVDLRRPPVDVEVAPISTDEWPTPARRPEDTRLDCRALRDAYGVELPPWRLSLAQVSDELNERGVD